MELLSVSSAKLTWLFDVNDINPHGEVLLPSLIKLLSSNYRFEQYPSSSTDKDTQSNGLAFKVGSFQLDDGQTIQVEMTIYNDGISANSYSSTRLTRKFLEDVAKSCVQELGLKFDLSMIRQEVPYSEITFTMGGVMGSLNSRLENFSAKVAAAHKHLQAPKFETGGIGFWIDNFDRSIKTTHFLIERKANAPFSENRFFSKAAIHTDDHIALLQDFEKLLG